MTPVYSLLLHNISPTCQKKFGPCVLTIGNYVPPPNEVWETYCVCSVSYYYYYYSSSFFLSFFRQKFVQHISRRLLNGNQWNFTGMLSTMSRCAVYYPINV